MENQTRAENLKETQKWYVPLKDRFKSFPPDKQITSDAEFFYLTRSAMQLEHSTLDLIMPTPIWIRNEIFQRRHRLEYITRVTNTGDIRVTSTGDTRVARTR